MTQVLSRRTGTGEAWVQTQASLSGFYGGQSGTGTGLQNSAYCHSTAPELWLKQSREFQTAHTTLDSEIEPALSRQVFRKVFLLAAPSPLFGFEK